MTHDPAKSALLRLASACRQAGADAHLRARSFRRATPDIADRAYVPAIAADLSSIAIRLECAADHLEHDAKDAELQSWLAHRAAGGDVILAPLPVVVGHDQRSAAPANDRWSWRSAAARLLRARA